MVGATLPLWIPASARMTNSVAGDNYFRTKIIELLKWASWVACIYEAKDKPPRYIGCELRVVTV